MPVPELPEVETTRAGIEPHLLHRKVASVSVRQPSLRWPVPESLGRELPGQQFQSVSRRAKYLLLGTTGGTLMVHLGMSGSLRLVNKDQSPGKHDHVDVILDDGNCLRYTDPRRFGSMLWLPPGKPEHSLLQNLGPEPLSGDFNGDYLFGTSRGRSTSVKSFIMDSRVVVGVGNIYANEALFMAGIHPRRAAGRIGQSRYMLLAECIKEILANAIRVGGTTLRDFTGSDGSPGYFKQSLEVYGRAGMPCNKCKEELKEVRIGQRSTVYCKYCQR